MLTTLPPSCICLWQLHVITTGVVDLDPLIIKRFQGGLTGAVDISSMQSEALCNVILDPTPTLTLALCRPILRNRTGSGRAFLAMTYGSSSGALLFKEF